MWHIEYVALKQLKKAIINIAVLYFVKITKFLNVIEQRDYCIIITMYSYKELKY